MDSDYIVAKAVRDFWVKNNYIADVAISLKQRYQPSEEWEDVITVAGWDGANMQNVIFDTDFCEGQQYVKDIKIAYLDDVIEKYFQTEVEQHGQL